jgi:hypothetical protein
MNYDRRSVGQSVLWGSRPDINYYLSVTVFFMSGAPSEERSGLSFVLVTWTASVQFSKFAAGPRQHSIYLSVFITPGRGWPSYTPRHWVARVPRGCHSPYPLLRDPEGYRVDKTRTSWKTTRPTILLLLRVFVAAETCLPSRCLAPKGGIHLTKPLPSNDMTDTHTDTQTDWRDLRSTPLRWAQVPWYTYQIS